KGVRKLVFEVDCLRDRGEVHRVPLPEDVISGHDPLVPGHRCQVWRAGYFPGQALSDADDHVRPGDETGSDKDCVAGYFLCCTPNLYHDAADPSLTGD